MDAQLLRSTFAVVERRAEHAVAFFYSHLFWHNPGVRELFPEDLGAQRDRLFAALTHVVTQLEDPGLPEYLAHLGRDHRKFLASPALYAAVGTSLTAAFAHAAGAAWSVEAEKAWTEAYGYVAEFMLRGAEEAAADGEPAWWDAVVVRHERLGEDLAVLTLKPRSPFAYRPGQYVSVSSLRVPRVWRTYSLANALRTDGTVDLHVSRIPGGAMSTALVDALRVGEPLRLSAPGGTLTSRTAPGDPRTYIAAGTGWAPVKALLEDAGSDAEARLFLVARSREYLYGRKDAERLRERIPGLKITYITSAPEHPRDQATERLLRALASCGNWPRHDVYVAGPPELLTETLPALHDLGASSIHHDRVPPTRPDRPLGPGDWFLSRPSPHWHNPAARSPQER
ncbi:FAD-binding oxidoreductase [Streptomyces sp. P9(2023)]|uniref:globin domain-containing protein n=1 Tax=Streptomyces sp. P9(2023) TaxID=3064394 RepID=UPI0028F45DE3|nr:globin domain-containing protein [Streptomyces sp. P9(2023)]MDT9691149.1 FAD-binding oxidoreductase [Streptomyces sp. P9(2023)]